MIDNPLNRISAKRGEQLPQAKLTEDDVREIRQQVARRESLRAELSRLSNRSIAHRLGVHYRTVDKITAFETWGHV